MNYKRGQIIVCWGLVLLLTAILVVLGGCEGSLAVDVIIENQTNQILTIYESDYNIGEVQPGGQIIAHGTGDEGEWDIEAKDSQGKTVFSATYTYDTDDTYHLQKIETGVYKAVIPPLQNK